MRSQFQFTKGALQMRLEIQLRSRYREDNRLIRIGGEESKSYKLKATNKYRMGQVDDGRSFIDPSGGPFMVEGEYLEEANAVIESIKDGIITFK